MKIYTRTGDDGTTSLFSGERVPKSHPRVTAYGTVDEVNSLLGLARSQGPEPEVDAQLLEIQPMLLTLGADLATTPGARAVPRVTDALIADLERRIDAMNQSVPAQRKFILPGGTPCAATLHVARATCRRAEREVFGIAEGDVSREARMFLNRLSDYLFVLARYQNFRAGVDDLVWTPTE